MDQFERYKNCINQYGATLSGVGWGDAAQHRLRLQVLIEGCRRYRTGPRSFLDVGCGWGAMYPLVSWSYHGIDAVPEMIEAAKARYPTVHQPFEVADVRGYDGPKRHYVVANGLFNWVSQQEMHQIIPHLWRLCTVGVVFNSLSTWGVDNPEEGDIPKDPFDVLGFCMNITPFCLLRTDYMETDFTIHMYRQGL